MFTLEKMILCTLVKQLKIGNNVDLLHLHQISKIISDSQFKNTTIKTYTLPSQFELVFEVNCYKKFYVNWQKDETSKQLCKCNLKQENLLQ